MLETKKNKGMHEAPGAGLIYRGVGAAGGGMPPAAMVQSWVTCPPVQATQGDVTPKLLVTMALIFTSHTST